MEGSTSMDAVIVKICEGNSGSGLRRITENVFLNIKTEANGTLASYYKDHKDEHMCMNCYNAIVVNGRSAFKEHAAELISVVTCAIKIHSLHL